LNDSAAEAAETAHRSQQAGAKKRSDNIIKWGMCGPEEGRGRGTLP
jgi:hypothetical protein